MVSLIGEVVSTPSEAVSTDRTPQVAFIFTPRFEIGLRLFVPPAPLAEKMKKDVVFRAGVTEGQRQRKQGKFAKLADVKKGLGDV